MESKIVKDTVRQIFTEYLRVNGLRKTPERYAILDTIYSIEGHFDIDSLSLLMSEHEKFRVSRATLYNTLNLLAEAQLVVKHQFGHSTQYERCYSPGKHHHHLVCTQCGKVTEVLNDELQGTIEGIKLGRFRLATYTLYIYGTCGACERSNRKKRKIINHKTEK